MTEMQGGWACGARWRGAALVLVTLLTIQCRALGQDQKTTTTNEVAAQITKIEQEPSSMARTTHAQELFELIRTVGTQAVTEDDITAMESLLKDRDDSIRYWIAASLGRIGPRAIRTVPALKVALTEIECSPASKTSESAIRIAIRELGAIAPKKDCQ